MVDLVPPVATKPSYTIMQNIKYNIPTCSDTAVCLCFFSPAGFKRPKENFLYVYKLLTNAKIPTFTIECVIGNQTPLLENPTLQVRSESCLFYKEQLYNLLVPKVPEQYTKLIFLDGDILFEDKNWIDNISNLLNTYNVVQPFETAVLMDINFQPIFIKKSLFYGIKNDNFKNQPIDKHHHGFSYALTRTFYNKIGGFFDKCIIGGGDTAFATLFHRTIIPSFYSSVIQPEYSRWNRNIEEENITYLPTTIYHLYHGSDKNRKYANRHILLEQFDLKCWDDFVYKNKEGVYEIKNKKINEIMKQYFISRKEDEVPSFTLSWRKRS